MSPTTPGPALATHSLTRTIETWRAATCERGTARGWRALVANPAQSAMSQALVALLDALLALLASFAGRVEVPERGGVTGRALHAVRDAMEGEAPANPADDDSLSRNGAPDSRAVPFRNTDRHTRQSSGDRPRSDRIPTEHDPDGGALRDAVPMAKRIPASAAGLGGATRTAPGAATRAPEHTEAARAGARPPSRNFEPVARAISHG